MKNQRPMTYATKFLNLQCSRSPLKVLPFLWMNYQSVHKIIVMFLLLWTINPVFISAQPNDPNNDYDDYLEILEDELKANTQPSTIRSPSINQIMVGSIQEQKVESLEISIWSIVSAGDRKNITDFDYDALRTYAHQINERLEAFEKIAQEKYGSSKVWDEYSFWEQYENIVFMDGQNKVCYEGLKALSLNDDYILTNDLTNNAAINAYRAAMLRFQHRMTTYRSQYDLTIEAKTVNSIAASKKEVIAECDKIVNNFHEVPAAIASQKHNITLMQDQITASQKQLDQAINDGDQDEIARLSQEVFAKQQALTAQENNLDYLTNILNNDLEIIKNADSKLYTKFIKLDALNGLEDVQNLRNELNIMMEKTEDLALNEFLTKTIYLEENELYVLGVNEIMDMGKSEMVRGQKACNY